MWGATLGIFSPDIYSIISIHAPRVGSDCSTAFSTPLRLSFQSTLPVWGATNSMSASPVLSGYFNPRSPCGERRPVFACKFAHLNFNPRSPCGERLSRCFQRTHTTMISIHAPRVGSDRPVMQPSPCPLYFNPRSPCGERLQAGIQAFNLADFNPRSPCGERLRKINAEPTPEKFQSTLPVWGATRDVVYW